MEFYRSKLQPIIKLIPIPLGWLALVLVFFSTPRFLYVLREFSTSPQGKIRQVGLLLLTGFGVLVVLLLTFYLFIQIGKRPKSSNIVDFQKYFSRSPMAIRFWLTFLLIMGILFLQVAFSGQVENQLDQYFISVLQPLFIWAGLSCVLTFINLLIGEYQIQLQRKDIWLLALLFFLVFVAIGLLFLALGIGYTQTDRVYGNFDLTGYPILGYQVLIALILTGTFSIIINRVFSNREQFESRNALILDIVLGLVLFIGALLVWKSIPFQTHMFFDQPRPPNYEYYPNSDSNLYDRTALNLLTTGKLQTYTYRFDEFIGRRPLLTIYLALLHKIAGPNYQDISSLQGVLFAILPVLVYILARSMSSWPAGLMAGILIIFREWNGLRLSDTVTGVHTQLLMSEIPAMIMLVIFLIVLTRAVRKKSSNAWSLAAGGVLGLAMLIRQELGIIYPFISLGVIWNYKSQVRRGVSKVILILAGLIIAITPWMVRNWNASGKIYFDLPNNRMERLLETLGIGNDFWKKDSPNSEGLSLNIVEFSPDLDPYVEENFSASSRKLAAQKSIIQFNPDEGDTDPSTFVLVANHFSNQLIQSVVYLPNYLVYTDIDFLSKLMIGKIDRYYGGILYSPEKYVKLLPYWWSDWSGKIPIKSLLPSLVTVFLISLGLSAANQKDRSTAYLPLLAYLGYISIYSLERASGGRFLQEMDWVFLLYYSVGLIAGFQFLFNFHTEPQTKLDKSYLLESEPKSGRINKPIVKILPIAVIILFIGFLPVVIEYISSSEYTEQRFSSVVSNLLETDQSLLPLDQQDSLLSFLEADGSAIHGTAFYPRFFDIGENLRDIRPVVLGKIENRYTYQRTEFYLIGTYTSWVILPREKIAEVLPHGSHTLSIGCQQDGALDAVVVMLLDDQDSIQEIYWRDGIEGGLTECPLVWPGQEIDRSLVE